MSDESDEIVIVCVTRECDESDECVMKVYMSDRKRLEWGANEGRISEFTITDELMNDDERSDGINANEREIERLARSWSTGNDR